MEENGENKNKRIILWISLGIVLMILIAGVVIVGLPPSLNESASNEIAIPEPPQNRPTPIVITPWYLLPYIDIGDGGFITNDPCGPPCFWNITPGVTTLTEVNQIIEDKGITGACESLEEDGNINYIYCGYVFSVSFFKKSDTVSMIDLDIQVQKLPMIDVINSLGPPDRVYVEIGELPDAPDFLNMWILYDDILTEIRLQTQDIRESKGFYQLSETTMVDSITYYENEGYKNSHFYKHASAWEGYGDYEGQWYTYP